MQTATVAGGCFWCVEAVLEILDGVESVESGYCNGQLPNPSYRQVCGGHTGHAEAVRVVFDPERISYRDLLTIFLLTHDPTTLNRQGADEGTQYRSAIFFHDADQEKTAHEVIAELTAKQLFPRPIVTEVTAAATFYPAEDYHQDYYRNNPNQGYCQAVINPKVAKLRQLFAKKLQKPE
jgi:peptide-methionine (S)-S-oxide reductase